MMESMLIKSDDPTFWVRFINFLNNQPQVPVQKTTCLVCLSIGTEKIIDIIEKAQDRLTEDELKAINDIIQDRPGAALRRLREIMSKPIC